MFYLFTIIGRYSITASSFVEIPVIG